MSNQKEAHPRFWAHAAISMLAAIGGTAFGLAAMAHIVSDFTTSTSENFNKAMDRLAAMERDRPTAPLTPYGASNQTPMNAKLESDPQMRPGWIARVFVPPSNRPYVIPKSDIGTFVLDEIQFNLLAHEGHGIYQPHSAAYRLKANFRAEAKGCYQFGIEARMRGFEENKPLQTRLCKFRIYVGAKYIVKETMKLSPSKPQAFVAGLVDLDVGVHPIDVEIFCDLGPNQSGADINLSITTREPGSSTFVARRDFFVHDVSSEFGPVRPVRAATPGRTGVPPNTTNQSAF